MSSFLRQVRQPVLTGSLVGRYLGAAFGELDLS